VEDVEAISAQLRALRDIEDIKSLKARYARLVDLQDWGAWSDLLTDDFRLESDAGIHEGRDAVVSMVSSALTGGTTVHHVLAPEIEITGPNDATGVWAMDDIVVLPGDTPFAFRGWGHYRDTYARTPQGWRVRSSVETRLRIEQLSPPTTQGGNQP
jgi:hypothetical protein